MFRVVDEHGGVALVVGHVIGVNQGVASLEHVVHLLDGAHGSDPLVGLQLLLGVGVGHNVVHFEVGGEMKSGPGSGKHLHGASQNEVGHRGRVKLDQRSATNEAGEMVSVKTLDSVVESNAAAH